jgi:hypothetical protein
MDSNVAAACDARAVGPERRASNSVDHGPGAHDALANADAGAIWLTVIPFVMPIIVTRPRRPLRVPGRRGLLTRRSNSWAMSAMEHFADSQRPRQVR